ncbi:MAG: hypothetical protein U5K51_09085 [Flavobacteriaceae bacterium]|nr:hypothetical protein [Flavobacteriaceae bacterium]
MRSIGPIIFTIMLTLYGFLAILFFYLKEQIPALDFSGILVLLASIFVVSGNRPLNDLFLTLYQSYQNGRASEMNGLVIIDTRKIFLTHCSYIVFFLSILVPINKSKIPAL